MAGMEINFVFMNECNCIGGVFMFDDWIAIDINDVSFCAFASIKAATTISDKNNFMYA